MDTVKILRELTRHRLLLSAACLLALLVGAAVLYTPSLPPKSRDYTVGVASASILLDTPSSQVVDVAPKGSDTLGNRANLLASLMVDGDLKNTIAHDAGINPPNDLVGNSPSIADQTPATPATRSAPQLTTQALTDNSGAQLPIIQIQTQAATAATASALATAAVTGLRDYLDSTAARQRIPDAQRLKITSLGAAQATTATRGPSPVLAVAAALLTLTLLCTAILTLTRLIANWRATAPDHSSTPEPGPQPTGAPAARVPAASPPAPAVATGKGAGLDSRRLPSIRRSLVSASRSHAQGPEADEPQVGTA